MLNTDLVVQAKWAFSARRIPQEAAVGLDVDVASARAGQLILGRVISVGQHGRVQLATGRPSRLYPGDLIVMPCGGCLGRMVWRHDKMKPPTRVQPLGLLTDAAGVVLETKHHAVPTARQAASLPLIIVIGTAMNSGKTTATVALTHGLTRAGWKVAALKGTGTGSFGDVNEYADAGAAFVGDFTDAGMVTTYLEPLDRIKSGIDDLLAAAEAGGADVAVMELADGIFQTETAALLADAEFMGRVSGSIFACGDAVAAAGGVAALAPLSIRPLCLTGLLSCSPMASAEALTATGVPVIGKNGLLDPAVAASLLARCKEPGQIAA